MIARFRSGVHWSLMQVEYATDLVFHKQDVLRPLYEALIRTAIHAVKCEQVATFLGHRLTESYEGEIGNDFSTRLEGTRIKHYMGPAAIKMYDKFAWSCGWRPPATTSPSSSTTAGWNIATGRGR